MAKKKTLYQIDLTNGYCGMIAAYTVESAKKQALKEHGTNNLHGVHKATDEEIEHFKGMNGELPKV